MSNQNKHDQLILAMAIVGQAKYTRACAKFRGDAARGERRKLLNSRVPFTRNFVRVRVYFARPTIAIARIRDNAQFTNQDQSQLGLSNFFARQVARKIVTCNSNLNQNQSNHNITFDTFENCSDSGYHSVLSTETLIIFHP